MATVGILGYFGMASSGTPTVIVDLTGYVKSVKFSRNGETFDVTTFGNTTKKWVKGLIDATLDVEFFYHATPFTQINNLLSYTTGGVSFEYGPEGVTSGNVKISQVGTLNTSTGVGLMLEKFDENTDVGAVKMMSCSFKISGQVTVGTYI